MATQRSGSTGSGQGFFRIPNDVYDLLRLRWPLSPAAFRVMSYIIRFSWGWKNREWTAENLHGRSRLRLDGSWRLDRQRRVCTIDASTQVGQDIARLFTGYLSQEFGEKAFSVQRPAKGQRGDQP